MKRKTCPRCGKKKHKAKNHYKKYLSNPKVLRRREKDGDRVK